MINTELKRISIHESGHALMYVLVGGTFQWVTIHPGTNNMGMVLGPKVRGTLWEVAINKTMSSYAGHCAEEIYLGKAFSIFDSPQSQSDLVTIMQILKGFDTQAEAESFFNWIIQRTLATLSKKENRDKLELISETLLDKGLLTFKEVKNLVSLEVEIPVELE